MLTFLIGNARWLGAGFLLSFMSSFGQTYFVAIFSGEIRSALELTHGQFGTIYGMATLASAATLIWIGKMADFPRLGRVGAFIAAALGLASLMLAGAVGPVTLFLALFGLRLFGQGMMWHTSQTAIARWFAARRGQALAIAGFGMPVSEAIFPILAVTMIGAFGWRQTWSVAATFLFVVAVPVLWWLLSQDRTPRARAADGPDAERFEPVRDWQRSEVLRDGAFYLLLLGILAPSFIGTGILFNQVHIVEIKGWSLSLFASAFPLYAFTAVAVSYLYGWMIDQWGAIRLLAMPLVPYAAGVFLLTFGDAPATIFVFMMLAGATAGMTSTLNGALWPELYGTRYLGAIRAMAMSAMVLASAASPFVLGVLIDAGVPFERQLFVMGLYFVFAVGLLGTMGVVLNRRNPRIAAAASSA